ncbi:MAG: VCBS repeat-containing protein [Williamsia sp.]|nr:VCBS repeat-containing protein [Williamsia sp.]
MRSICCFVFSLSFPFLLAAQAGKLPAANQAGELRIVEYNNPGAVVDLGVGLWAWPVPMDFDGDGDKDLLVSCPDKPYNGLYFFENKSGSKTPVFAAPVRLGPALKDVQVSFMNGQPRVLVPGAEIMQFTKSFGTEKKELYPVDSILKDFKTKPRFDQWKLTDYDADGDEDIIVGVDDWTDYGWDNAYNKAGTWTNGPLHGYVYLIENLGGKYINRGRLKAGGKTIDVYGAPSPNIADFDGDGDPDLICGEFLDRMTWFENTGTKENPRYAAGRFLENGAGLIKMDLEMIVPVAIDWNGDGHTDLVVGDEDGRVALIENTGKVVNKMPVFASPVYFKQQGRAVKFGALATPVGVDWDGDGDQDIISGNSAGYIGLIENLGGFPAKLAPPRYLQSDGRIIRIQAGPNGSIQGPAEAKWGYTTLSVADWDGDGLLDLIVNSIWGKVIWYRNKGTKTKPVLTAGGNVQVDWGGSAPAKPEWIWWTPEPRSLATQWRTTPVAIDWNRDGLTDLVMLDTEGYLSFFERTRKGNELLLKPAKRIFMASNQATFNANHAATDSTPGLLRLNSEKFGKSGRRKFSIADWDGDGKPDLLVNSLNVTIMQNGGLKDGQWVFTNGTPLSTKALAGHDTSPTTVDWNRDGIPDLLVGAEDGHFYYLANPRGTGKQ